MEEENTNTNMSNNGLLSDETEKLLKRYLKLEIASKMWNGIFRILVICLMGFSVIFSATTLLPQLMTQLGALGNVYQMMPENTGSGINSITGFLENFENLSDEQKEIVITKVKGASDSATVSTQTKDEN